MACAALAFVPSSHPRAQTKPLGISPYCNAKVSEKDTRSLEHSQMKRLEVVISDVRKWAKNNFKILRSRSKTILPKYKKKFDGTVTAHFANGLSCTFNARIRQNGDWKDHIQFIAGQVVNSLDVRLTDGHLNGVVRFKLLIPETRQGKKEVILTNFLRAAGFLAPRTALIKVDLMGQPTEMIFQEKPRKEMLEDNYLREGPVLEGDERFSWATTAKGTGDAFNDSLVFSRLININWAAKGPSSLEISKEAVTRLNAGFVKANYLKFVRKEKLPNVWTYFDNVLLAAGNQPHLRHLNAYDALLQAANAGHALRPHNRTFYYDPMYGRFHPIYYDGNPRLGILAPPSIKPGVVYFGYARFAIEGAQDAKKIVERLDPGDLAARLDRAGVPMTRNKVLALLNQFKENLDRISKFKAPDYSVVESPSPADYVKALGSEENYNVWLLRFTSRVSSATCDLCPAQACDFKMKACRAIKLDAEETSELLAGRLKYKGTPVLFQEADPNPSADAINDKVTRLSSAIGTDVEVITSPGMKVSIDEGAKSITFNQGSSSDWAMLRGGSLVGVTVVFKGARKTTKTPANAQRFNRRLLTGCLTFLDMVVDKLNVSVEEGGCEDGVNMVRVKGQVDTIKVSNTISDAIDVDFSEISFGAVQVTDAQNDCVDFSSGKYVIRSLLAQNCGDKGVSVGEGSQLDMDHARVEKAVIGVAVKDSSRLSARSFQVRNTGTCITTYRKKQEFSGAIAKVADTDCGGAGIQADPGSVIVTGNGS
jgi:hypothetical protein